MAAAGKQRKGKAARRLIVHLGVQKTGSTAIQRHLRRNAGALAQRLIVRTPDEGTPMRPLGRAAVAYSLDPAEDRAQALRIAFRDVLDTLPANDVPVLLSHENLSGAMPGNGGETRLFPCLPQIAALLLREAQDFKVDFVLYTRSMNGWKSSVWAQAVRTDGYTATQAQFLEAVTDLPGWGDLIRRIGDEVGADRLTRLKTEDETDPLRPGTQLLRHAGLDDAAIAALAPLDGLSNQRLSDGATEFLRHLNQLSLNPHARGKVVDLVARRQNLFTATAPSEGTL